MNQHVILRVYSETLPRQKVLHSFFPDNYYVHNQKGLILKFNNSLGFMNVSGQMVDGCHLASKVKTSKNYLSPADLLITNMYWLNAKNEIVTFIIPVTEMKFGKYSYSTLEMTVKFQSFLYKVYGRNIRIEMSIGDRPRIALKDKVLSFIYCVTAQGEAYSCEMSMHRGLKDKEINYILDIMKSYVSYDPVIRQYWCETCYNYHKDAPIHMEFTSRKYIKKLYNSCVEQGVVPDASIIEALRLGEGVMTDLGVLTKEKEPYRG